MLAKDQPVFNYEDMEHGQWEFWIDVGGTFTDCCARSPGGAIRWHKLLSSGVTKGIVGAASSRQSIVDLARQGDPAQFWRGAVLKLLDAAGQPSVTAKIADFDVASGALTLRPALRVIPKIGQRYEISTDEEAPLLAVRYLTGTSLGAALPPVAIRLGTTRGTNALITRRGARTALVTTRGFGDILHIGYQNRPKLFELNIRKPQPLFSATIEINERIAADGNVLVPPDPDEVRRQLIDLRSQQIESLAICLLHGSEYPAHERLVADIACDVGFEEVSVSHEVMPLVKIVARGDTTVVDAYLNPVLRRYTAQLESSMPGCDLRLVTSSGGLMRSGRFSGKDSILSGPAAGVVGFSRVAQTAGFTRAIGLDMGGTSTDVSRFDGHYEYQYETEKSGVRIVSPMLV
jgi:5-oxoprolinase (ATP-hydrolysing)